jgi:transmembrane sensor
MQVDDGPDEHAEQALIGRAVRGTLSAADTATLERHLAACPTCAAELEATRIFEAAVARGPGDEGLDDRAVDAAMARLGEADEALDDAAVARAMARLDPPAPIVARPPRRLRPAIGVAAFGVAAAAAGVVAFFNVSPPTPTTTAETAPVRPLVLPDGSEIAPDDAATTIRVGEQTAARVVVSLRSGAARFRVRHDNRRLFRVDAGPIQIDDLGTVFRVAHETKGNVRVVVAEGRVAVISSTSGARVELGAGEERVFSSTDEAVPTIDRPSEASPSAPPVGATAPARGQPRARLADDPADLLAAADVARRSHDPRAAVAPLRRLVDHYPKDPRAPSAAFTLGWVLLTDLNRPREAAAAFAVAERIAPRGALAEDAAARVAEAWQNAGESRRAADAARHYEQMYPTGRYIGLMHGLAGKR